MIYRIASFATGDAATLAQLYGAECVPAVRAEPGNVDCFLLAPTADGDMLACTVWASEADAARYDASGRGAEIAARVRHLFAGPPTLRTYRRATP